MGIAKSLREVQRKKKRKSNKLNLKARSTASWTQERKELNMESMNTALQQQRLEVEQLRVKFYELALVSFTNPGSRIFQCFFIYTQHENQGIFCLNYLILRKKVNTEIYLIEQNHNLMF